MMANPLTPDRFVAALRAEGCKVVLVGDWRNHNRNHKGPWGPVYGVIDHHTVSKGSAATVELCRAGYAALPGPLCHGVITKDGTVHVVSAGRANHAGGGDPDVLASVRAEDYGTRPPVPDVGNTDGVDGNRHFYGFECENLGDGKDPWPTVQVDAMVRANAGLIRAHGWGEKSAIGHHEWSDDKTDPRGPGDIVKMPNIRARIAERLAHDADWDPYDPTPPDRPNPIPGGPVTMTMPNRTLLSKTADVQLAPGVPTILYWDNEHTDDPNEHGAGGKTILSGGRYDGVVNLSVTGLAASEYLDVVAVEEDAAGTVHESAMVSQQVAARQSTPLSGFVYDKLQVRVTNRGAAVVTITEAWVNVQSWNG